MKSLVITGGSAGIGYNTAKLFYESDYKVINLSRRSCDIDGVINISCDLSDLRSLTNIGGQLKESIGDSRKITLIHNASKMNNDKVDSATAESFREVLEINLVAPNILNQLCIPLMKPDSAILYVGSTLSEKAVPGSFSYVTTKHAVIGMMRATCQDLIGRHIHTACICPGFTDTEMLREHVPEEAMPTIVGMSAFNQLISPGEIAETLFWVAEHPVTNGSVLHANLGQKEQ